MKGESKEGAGAQIHREDVVNARVEVGLPEVRAC